MEKLQKGCINPEEIDNDYTLLEKELLILQLKEVERTNLENHYK